MWDATTNEMSAERRRQANLYVFALLAHREKPTVDAMDLSQWEFYLLPTRVLDASVPNQNRLALSTLLRLKPARASYEELASAIDRIANEMMAGTQPEPAGPRMVNRCINCGA
jgi:hypothetical protein